MIYHFKSSRSISTTVFCHNCCDVVKTRCLMSCTNLETASRYHFITTVMW